MIMLCFLCLNNCTISKSKYRLVYFDALLPRGLGIRQETFVSIMMGSTLLERRDLSLFMTWSQTLSSHSMLRPRCVLPSLLLCFVPLFIASMLILLCSHVNSFTVRV